MRRFSWPIAAAAALVVVLALLAVLQYRWLGDVSAAERDRLRAGLRARAADLARDFDGEVTRLYAAFHLDPESLGADPAAALGGAYERWRSSAAVPDLVRAVYLVDGAASQPSRLDLTDRTLAPADWPADLRPQLTPSHDLPAVLRGLPPPLLLADAVDARMPGLVIAVPRLTRTTSTQGQTTIVAEPGLLARSIVVVLDRDRLVHGVLEPLVARHFGEPASSAYAVTIARRDDPAATVFTSIDPPIDAAAADVTAGLFDLRLDELSRATQGPASLSRPGGTERVALTIVRRGNAGDAAKLVSAMTDQPGAWEVRARPRGGPLEGLVAASRRRNLAISLGIVGILGASVLLVVAAADRQHRLAAQQMEFVAGVSHELRTPLAVICSAGENLADGVVADAAQVKRYGALIQTEGRRLADMVERVLEFAGINSSRPRARADVDLSAVIADATRALDADARDRGVRVAVQAAALPHLMGDADALRSAVQNVVGNAVKYSPGGATVDVTAAAAPAAVRITVADRGLGIDAADLPHVFEPFYRGRRAIEAQVRGAGVGLSVVRHIVDAHDGRIDIRSEPGQGTTVTIELPIAPDGGSRRTRPTSEAAGESRA